MNQEFLEDVREGLSQEKKYLKSKYFYDAIGDQIFVEIMNMPEYYLTDAEHEIFEEKSDKIIDAFAVDRAETFDLIELGSGDGTKTKRLLAELLQLAYSFDYLPIDISETSLKNLLADLRQEFPKLRVETQQGDYFSVLQGLKNRDAKKIILFLGSNLGNMRDREANEFLCKLDDAMNPGDMLLLGLDLIKPQSIVLPAYDDAAGITARFNLNLLHRMNRELGADFNVEQFSHRAAYTEEEGIARSFIVSEADQTVYFKALDMQVHFAAGENIDMEISRKYNDEVLAKILDQTDLTIVHKLLDSQALFADYILAKG